MISVPMRNSAQEYGRLPPKDDEHVCRMLLWICWLITRPGIRGAALAQLRQWPPAHQSQRGMRCL